VPSEDVEGKEAVEDTSVRRSVALSSDGDSRKSLLIVSVVPFQKQLMRLLVFVFRFCSVLVLIALGRYYGFYIVSMLLQIRLGYSLNRTLWIEAAEDPWVMDTYPCEDLCDTEM
jgi:hypothetical protein